MAGVGFELRKLSRDEGLLAPLIGVCRSAVVAAGPWMFTIIAMALIGRLVEFGVSKIDIATFRVIVIYAFSLSLVITSPVLIVAMRLLADQLYLRQLQDVPALVASTCLLSMALSAAFAAVTFIGIAQSPIAIAIAGIIACTLVAGIWVTLLFCGAVRDYSGITWGFVLGMAVALLGATTAAWMDGTAVEMAWGFCTGLAFIFFWLLSRILLTFPHPTASIGAAIVLHLAAMRRYGMLAIGGFAAASAIWIDKWILWCSPLSEYVGGGLVHAPLYDSPMFVAYLSIIPSLAIFLMMLETEIFERITDFQHSIERHATLKKIRSNAAAIERTITNALSRVTLLQLAFCLLFAVLAPVVIDALDMLFKQVAILRFGAIGALFQLLFLICSTLLLFFNRHGLFAALQILFLALQAGLMLVTLSYGEAYLGVGYLLATVVCALLSVIALERTTKDIAYLTFSAAAGANG